MKFGSAMQRSSTQEDSVTPQVQSLNIRKRVMDRLQSTGGLAEAGVGITFHIVANFKDRSKFSDLLCKNNLIRDNLYGY